MKKEGKFIDSVIQSRWISHLLFWVCLVFTFTMLAALNSGTFKTHIVNYLAMLPSQMAAAYLLNYYQIPQLLLKKRYVWFGISFIVLVYLFSAMARWSVVHIAEPLIRENFVQESLAEILLDSAYLFSVYFPGVYIYAFIMVIVKAVKNRFEEKHRFEQLQREKATNELKFLKAQIQPHFLFNTLNNLYALTLAKSDVAPEVVLKLSELLDFMLYQSEEERIPVAKEIELIQGIIDLESLRSVRPLNLTFAHHVDRPDAKIAPLILLPLVENAFKHGANSAIESGKIDIVLDVQKEVLTFKVVNTKSKLLKDHSKGLKKGIGTHNLRRQLELNYPEKHRLEVSNGTDSYTVSLQIDLNGPYGN
ncbi:MAG: histidine kinase [Bacteroidota bacterium]